MKGLNISIRMKLSDPTQPENLFLNMHGYDELPQGFEVHHIIPLSEGEADTPNNMILLSETDHDHITAMQSAYYQW